MFFSKLKMTQEVFNAWDVAIKVLGIFALIISGIFAYSQYKDNQEREYKRIFYEKQMAVINDIFKVFSEINSAVSQSEKQRAAQKFWMIYHGEGQVYLTPELYASLNAAPVPYVAGCIDKIETPRNGTDCINWSASQSIFGFAKIAREQLAKTWDRELKEVGAVDPMVPREYQKTN